MRNTPRTKTKAVPTKLTIPNSETVLPRERLFQLIERCRYKKVIWISGPAGSGKTTLAASYMQTCNAPCLWYQLDEVDADISTFFYYMGLAARRISPRNRTPLPLLTPEYLLGIPGFAKRFFEKLCEKLIAKSRTRTSEDRSPAIVFDNYQDVPEDSLFHGIIFSSLSSIPRGVNVFVLSRDDPPPAYVNLRAAGEMALLGWKNLRLTADESDDIARLKAGKDLESQTLSALRKTCDGWVAGLVLLLESLQIEDPDFQPPGYLPREEIFDYFATELFDRSSPDVRDFLLKTSFFPKMSGRTAEELSGNRRASRILNDLNRKNYFTTIYASHCQTFEYHPLLREFLLNKAKETITAVRYAAIRRKAAMILEKEGYIEDAAALFLKAEEWPDAARMVLTNAPAFISQGRWQTLLGWIVALPEHVRQNEPWLLYWMGVCMFPTSPDMAKDCFAGALGQFRSRRDAAGSFLSLSGMLDLVTLRSDTFYELDRLILLADEILKEFQHQFPSPMIESLMVASMLLGFMLRQPNHPSFEYWENRGFALVGSTSDLDSALRIVLALSMYRVFSGELEKAEIIFASLDKRVDLNHAAPMAILSYWHTRAIYHWLSADFDQSRRAVEDAIALANSSGVHMMDSLLLGDGAACALSMGDISTVDQHLEKMIESLSTKPSACAEAFYNALKAWKCLLREEFLPSVFSCRLGH